MQLVQDSHSVMFLIQGGKKARASGWSTWMSVAEGMQWSDVESHLLRHTCDTHNKMYKCLGFSFAAVGSQTVSIMWICFCFLIVCLLGWALTEIKAREGLKPGESLTTHLSVKQEYCCSPIIYLGYTGQVKVSVGQNCDLFISWSDRVMSVGPESLELQTLTQIHRGLLLSRTTWLLSSFPRGTIQVVPYTVILKWWCKLKPVKGTWS